ncbi:hypothetical protein KJ657_04745 [Patescibacteria group bacterium]|nr:hypothetical protein [Patescibacteria group bacterium]MBU1016362.1 hypothetical protein [Patescibacteria group bacterium]MBU1684656.1 hypothetical protein [Patescibacteria group bacterium]MBU1938432.1 hypothetical protein [Patescibacteria group bacterium]
MTNIPEVYLLQATKKNLEMARTFQEDMGALFFEHTMYDVKDALTSILALCDMEDMKQVPQVKKCIQRVTDLLNDVRLYHESTLFNINHLVINVINVLKKNYKSKIRISEDLSSIKAHTESNRNHVELVLLYLLIEAAESCQKELNIKIELVQKERDAVITIRLGEFQFSSVILKEITDFHNQAVFRMQIDVIDQGTEIVIRLPLSFETREKEHVPASESTKITLSSPKRVSVHGAQERT